MHPSNRSLISLRDLAPRTLQLLIDRAVLHGAQDEVEQVLSGRIVGTLFLKTSTRTRASFSVGALRLGARLVAFGPQDLQLNTGESLGDTGRVLGGYLDALVVRSTGPEWQLRELAAGGLVVINAMSDEEHPTQCIADLATIKAQFQRLHGLHIVYIGEGNSTAAALALGVALLGGIRLTLLTPPRYGLPKRMAATIREFALKSRAKIAESHEPAVPKNADVVYATRWETTGSSKADPRWREVFRPFAVDSAVMAGASRADRRTIFMHDLPAVRGEDVSSAVLDGAQSVAFVQARYKEFAARAVLEYALCGPQEARVGRAEPGFGRPRRVARRIGRARAERRHPSGA